MDEDEMTDEQMEATTSPFTDAVDTNNDGEVSKEELDDAVDKLADLEELCEEDPELYEEVTGESTEHLRNNESDVSLDPIPCTEDLEGCETIEYPSKESLTKDFPPSTDDANLSYQQDWARYCIKFSDENNVHFLGLCVKTGEPLFKAKK